MSPHTRSTHTKSANIAHTKTAARPLLLWASPPRGHGPETAINLGYSGSPSPGGRSRHSRSPARGAKDALLEVVKQEFRDLKDALGAASVSPPEAGVTPGASPSPQQTPLPSANAGRRGLRRWASRTEPRGFTRLSLLDAHLCVVACAVDFLAMVRASFS